MVLLKCGVKGKKDNSVIFILKNFFLLFKFEKERKKNVFVGKYNCVFSFYFNPAF